MKKKDDFLKKFKSFNFKEGEVLFTAENSPPGIFFLKNGFVRQFIISSDGNELTIHIFGPSSHFPMTWALGISNRYNFQALTSIETKIIPKEKALGYLKSNPQELFEFTGRLLKGLNGLSLRIESIIFGKTYNRVISVLLYLASHFGTKDGKKIVISHKFTHNEIASLVGVTREHVSLEMEKLKKEKLIRYKNHIITLLDPINLENIISQN